MLNVILQNFKEVVMQEIFVKFNELFTLDLSVSYFSDTPLESSKPSLGAILLQLLESTPFSEATWGDCEILEQQVQASRNAWISDERVLEIKKTTDVIF